MTTSLASSLPKFEDLATSAGLDKQVIVFLRDRGVTSSGVLYHLFSERSKIGRTLEPLKVGVKIGENTLKMDEVALDVATASLEHIVDEIEFARAAQLQPTTAPPSSQPAQSSPATATTDPSKAPKTLPKGYWAKRIKDFESSQIEGRNRVFPVHLLVGAEETLARMVFEAESSRLFTPVKLREVISSRNFTPSRQVNPFAKTEDRFTEALSLDHSGALVRRDRRIPEPQKALTVIDALEAVRWAMIFARWGEEFVIGQFVDFFINLVRDNQNKIPQIREYYRKSSWDLGQCIFVQRVRSRRASTRSSPARSATPLRSGCLPTARARARTLTARASRRTGSAKASFAHLHRTLRQARAAHRAACSPTVFASTELHASSATQVPGQPIRQRSPP